MKPALYDHATSDRESNLPPHRMYRIPNEHTHSIDDDKRLLISFQDGAYEHHLIMHPTIHNGSQSFALQQLSHYKYKRLSMISDRMMSSIQDMQRQLVQTDLKFSTALEKITEENDRFKQEIRNEVQLLHQPASNTSTSVTNSVNPTLNISSTHSPPSVPTSVASPPVSTVDPQDLQTQMMALLTTTFSKLTTVMTENKSTETKSDWPKFGGDTKKFKHWYLAIVAQLSLTPWKEFYDSSTNSILPVTTNTTLNEKLYAKLLLCLEGQVFQDMISRKHL